MCASAREDPVTGHEIDGLGGVPVDVVGRVVRHPPLTSSENRLQNRKLLTSPCQPRLGGGAHIAFDVVIDVAAIAEHLDHTGEAVVGHGQRPYRPEPLSMAPWDA